MVDKTLQDISKKLTVLISLTIRQLTDDKEFGGKTKRKQSNGDIARYLADLGLDATDIAEILNAPLGSVRTFLTPKQRK